MSANTFSRREMLKYGGIAVGSAALAGPMLAACGSGDGGDGGGSAKDVNIVLLAPLTGIEAAWGPQQAQAYKDAAAWLNRLGGIKSLGGAHLKVTVKDTETVPSTAASEAQHAASDSSTVMLTGCNQSGASIVVAQIAKQAKIPFLTGTDIDPRIPKAGGGWAFQIASEATVYTSTMLDFLADTAKSNGVSRPKVAILHTSSELGQACTEAAIPQARSHGFNVVSVDSYDSSKISDFTPFISKYASKGVQAVVGTQDPQPSVLIIRAMKQLKWQPEFLGALDGNFGNPTWMKAIGKDANYTYSSQPWFFNIKGLGMDKFVAEYKKRFNRVPDSFAQSGFAVISTMADALERAGSTDRNKLQEALRKTHLEAGKGPIPCLNYGGVKFNSDGRNTAGTNVIGMTYNKQNYTVSPAKNGVKKPVWPRPEWSKF